MKKIISIIITVTMLMSMFTGFTAFASEPEVEFDFANGKVVHFPLSEEVGANSTLFLNLDEAKAATAFPEGYYKGLDFGGRALKEGLALTDGSAAKTKQAPTGTDSDTDISADTFQYLLYETSASEDVSSSKTGVVLYDDGEGNYWWKLKEGKYEVVPPTEDVTTYSLKWNDESETEWLVNPTEKIVKIIPTDTQYIEDPELKAKFQSLNEAEIDVADGRYADISFLIGDEGWQRSLYITPVYKDGDGTKNNLLIKHHSGYKVDASTGATSNNIEDIAFSWSSPMLNYQYGLSYLKNFDGAVSNNNMIKFRKVTLEADPNRVIDKIKFTAASQFDHPLYVVAMQGSEVSIETVMTTLTNEITTENYYPQLNTLATIDAMLADMGATVNDLPDELAEKYNATVNAIKLYDENALINNDKITNFPISEATGANSKYFMLYDSADYKLGENYKDYVPGLDYSSTIKYNSEPAGCFPTGDFETDKENLSLPARALVYKVNAETTSAKILNLKEENDKYYWQIKGVSYQVNPFEKVIQLYTSVKTDNVADASLVARFNTLNTLTFDVPDGNYDSIGVLAASSWNRDLNITLNYDDSTKNKYTKTVSLLSDAQGQDNGRIQTQTVTTHSEASGARTFQPIEVDADSSKKLVSVTLASSYRADPIMIISAWGKNDSIATIINSLLAEDDENYNAEAEIEKLNKLDEALNENDISYDDLDADLVEKIDNAKEGIINYISESLPETVTLDTIEDVKASIKLVQQAAKDYEISLPAAAQARITALETEISKLYVVYSPSVDIPLTSGANSKVFWEEGVALPGTLNNPNDAVYTSGTYDYILDWKQDLWWDSNIEKGVNDTWGHSPVYYSYTNNLNYIPLDEKGNWTVPYLAVDENGNNYVENFKYHIDVNSKIIQLKCLTSTAQKFDLEATALYADRLSSMKNATVDVENNYFDTIYILATTVNGQAINPNFKAQVYYEGEDSPTDAPVIIKVMTDAQLLEKYQAITNDTSKTHLYDFKANTGYASSEPWYTYPIKCNPLKKVEKITFTMTEGNRVLLIASMLGKAASPEDIINAIPSEVTADNYEDFKNAVNYLDEYIAENNVDIESNAAIYSQYTEIQKKLSIAEDKILIGKVDYRNDKILIKASNYTGADYNFNVLVSVLDENKNIVKFEKLDAVAKKDIVQETIEIDYVDPRTEGTSMRIFTVKSLASLQPLAPVYEVPDTVYMFVGDSITHNDLYVTYVEGYYQSRYPNKAATFINAGRGGDSANGAQNRYSWDIAPNNATDAIIMFGMNDVGRDSWTLGPSDEGFKDQLTLNQWRIDNCITNITNLANRLVADGAKVTLMTPSIYDTRDYSTKTNFKGVNSGLTEISEREKVLAKEYGFGLINLHDSMNAINNKVLNSGAEEMISSDRVHPNAKGHYVMAYNVIKTLFPDTGLVASVEIDATNSSVKAENATASNVVATNNSVSYTYKANAIPWAVTSNYKAVDGKYVNLTGELNREIIKVTGLEEGTYTIKFNNSTVGKFTNTELANGINIATLDTNPGQVQAMEVYNYNYAKHELVAKQRDFAAIHYSITIATGYDGTDAFIQNYIDTKATDTTSILFNYFKYRDELIPQYKKDIESFTEQARIYAVPQSFTVTITK